jgi:hypothetical protein
MPQSYEEILRSEIDQAEQQAFNLYQQIEHLEARVEGLKQALNLYLKSGQSAQTAKPAASSSPHPARRRIKRRGSRFDDVLQFIRESGTSGVTIEDMYRFAVRQGLKLKRTSIRSNVWNHKSKGMLEQMGDGRYRAATTSSTQKAAEQTEGSTGEPAEPSPKVLGVA